MNRIFASFIFVGLVLVVGCDQSENPPPTSALVEKPAATPTPAPPVVKPYFIDPFDMTMRRSTAFRIDGDLRPIWVVSGRIKNLNPSEVKSVSIRIQVTEKGTERVVDAATLVVNVDILPDSVSSFSRTIQLMPPDKPWNWNYDVIKVEPK